MSYIKKKCENFRFKSHTAWIWILAPPATSRVTFWSSLLTSWFLDFLCCNLGLMISLTLETAISIKWEDTKKMLSTAHKLNVTTIITIIKFKTLLLSSVQLLSDVQLFATPRTAVPQASLSITHSWSLLNSTSGHSQITKASFQRKVESK